MSKRRDIESHRNSLLEIRDIMNSMKSLAYMETRKLSEYLPPQQAIVKSIHQVAGDFLCFHPQYLRRASAVQQQSDVVDLVLLIGSERGFCADLNHIVKNSYEQWKSEKGTPVTTMVVGQQLYNLFEEPNRLINIAGASISEEIEQTLFHIVDAVSSLQVKNQKLFITVFHYDEDGNLITQQILPPFQDIECNNVQGYAPQIYDSTESFFASLLDHYLYAVLNEILYNALSSENQRRVSHLQGAIGHLDEKCAELSKRINALRQEEIIEEIEVILLSTTGQT